MSAQDAPPPCTCTCECDGCSRVRAYIRATTCVRGQGRICTCIACIERARRERLDEPVALDEPCQTCGNHADSTKPSSNALFVSPHIRCRNCLGVFCAECTENGYCLDCE